MWADRRVRSGASHHLAHRSGSSVALIHPEEELMGTKDHGPQIKDDETYERLREEGRSSMSKDELIAALRDR
jgi:hypothetical protein